MKGTVHKSPSKSQNSPKKIKSCKKPYWTFSAAALLPQLPPQNTPDDPKKAIKNFIHDSLKLPAATVEEITFHQVCWIPSKNPKKPPPIIVKFEHYKHKELIKSRGNQLKDTTYGMYNQFLKKIQDRRWKLVQIMKQLRDEGKQATLLGDKLYVGGTLYRDPNFTMGL